MNGGRGVAKEKSSMPGRPIASVGVSRTVANEKPHRKKRNLHSEAPLDQEEGEMPRGTKAETYIPTSMNEVRGNGSSESELWNKRKVKWQ